MDESIVPKGYITWMECWHILMALVIYIIYTYVLQCVYIEIKPEARLHDPIHGHTNRYMTCIWRTKLWDSYMYLTWSLYKPLHSFKTFSMNYSYEKSIFYSCLFNTWLLFCLFRFQLYCWSSSSFLTSANRLIDAADEG